MVWGNLVHVLSELILSVSLTFLGPVFSTVTRARVNTPQSLDSPGLAIESHEQHIEQEICLKLTNLKNYL